MDPDAKPKATNPARPTRPRRRFGALALVGAIALAAVLASLRVATLAQSAPLPRPAPVNGDRAFRYLEQICALGPRPAGSAANTRQRQLVAEHFRKHGGQVREQPFGAVDPLSGAKVAMVNLVGSWHPELNDRVVLGVHYDTRPFPDEEPDPKRRKDPFLGANDGASGVALLMEIAHHLPELATPRGVDLVLFDGEELVYDRVGEYFLGSKEFGRIYAEQNPRKFVYSAGLVLDMVADKNLRIEREPYSLDLAPDLVRDVWGVARRIKATAFKQKVGPAVQDDHLPLNNAGIPAIDIIDFDYEHWHTVDDLPKNCSGASLAQVGRVVTAWLAEPKPTPPRR